MAKTIILKLTANTAFFSSHVEFEVGEKGAYRTSYNPPSRMI